MISHFTENIYDIGIALSVSGGDPAPLVGHNAFLRWVCVCVGSCFKPFEAVCFCPSTVAVLHYCEALNKDGRIRVPFYFRIRACVFVVGKKKEKEKHDTVEVIHFFFFFFRRAPHLSLFLFFHPKTVFFFYERK